MPPGSGQLAEESSARRRSRDGDKVDLKVEHLDEESSSFHDATSDEKWFASGSVKDWSRKASGPEEAENKEGDFSSNKSVFGSKDVFGSIVNTDSDPSLGSAKSEKSIRADDTPTERETIVLNI